MNDILQSARAIAHTLLSYNVEPITDEILNSVIEKVTAINLSYDLSFDKKELFEILKSDFSIGKGEITIMSNEIEPWLNDEKSNINFELWNRYKLYMSIIDPSFPINDLDDFTDKILDKCINPKNPKSWDRRGMVVGHVQSGKTSNYVGLINKATDAGYKVIIVIAGTISSLRRQTQERIDAGFVGRSSPAFINNKGENKIIGVGKYKVDTDIYSLTSSYYKNADEGDFQQSVANRLNIPIGRNPVVFVIKKNKSILENLIDWFSKNENTKFVDNSPKLFDVPVLVIDDEADAASVNTTSDINEIKTINRLIRTLLNLFNQNTFIGYTATPYANLFISQDHNENLTTIVKNREYKIGEDLFPRDFIVNIKAPSNYFGAAKVFGLQESETEPLDIFRPINDYDPPFFSSINKSNKDLLPTFLPNSLLIAIKSFIITCAIRRIRGHEKKHNSMLIHVALLVKWIDRVAMLTNEKLREFKNLISIEDKNFILELKELFDTDFVPTTKNVMNNLDYHDEKINNISWNQVLIELKKASSKIEVRSVHGTKSTTNLEYHNIEEIDYNRYENGLSIIAVGGSRLSRGITLEGLTISYYLRTTKMYDSLMQMGRWFGYRPGYVDLCRLFTTNEIFDWFNHITLATEEMRNDFDEMTAALQKPQDYKLKVRNHHGLLTITSLAKLNFTENIKISFSGTNPQTYQFIKSKFAIESNFNNFKTLINSINLPELKNRKYIKNKVQYLIYPNESPEPICDFINSYRSDQPSIKNNTISEYIKTQSEKNKIKEWTICIVSNTDQKVFIKSDESEEIKKRIADKEPMSYELITKNEKITLFCSVRNQPQKNRHSQYYTLSKNQLDDIKARQVDLIINNLASNAAIKAQRNIEKKALLLIYALDERGTSNVNYGIPIIGFSIHFPIIENEEMVSYTATISNNYDEFPQEDDDFINQ